MRRAAAATALALLSLLLVGGCSTSVSGTADENALGGPSGDARVDALLRKLTLQEKIALIHGVPEPAATDQGEAGYWAGLPRWHVPALRFADGPPGILTRVPSTGMTATMGLAATFSRADANANGVVIGRDARARGIQVALQPFINLDRDQTFVRAYNTFGEDPLLTGEIAAAEIRGIQSEHVLAQAKHFLAYDGSNDVTVGQQALHELYAAPFEAAVQAGVASIMCSYNRINGAYACGNPSILTRLLREELGFRGFVTSDWGANHAAAFINAGLDLEMPGPSSRTGIPDYFGVRMLAAVVTGEVSEATVTDAAAHVLGQVDRFGWLDTPPSLAVTAEPIDADERIVEKTGEDAAVLLKDSHDALPLSGGALRSLALIGPGAGQQIAIGIAGEKALGYPDRQVSTLTVLRQLLAHSRTHLVYAVADDMTGVPVPAAQLSHEGKPGLRRDDGQIDAAVDFTQLRGRALPAGGHYRWQGALMVPQAGRYYLSLELLGALGSLSIDGHELGATDTLFLHGTVLQPNQDNVLPTTDGLDNVRRAIELSAGPHAIRIDVHADDSRQPMQVRLAWSTPAQQRRQHDAAVAAARAARCAVVFAWSQGQPVFALPDDQNQLIADVAAANPHTIVILNVSQPVAMPWLAHVQAVLQMWYPGDEGGWATARLLLGRVSPAGRLPFTWPQRLSDTVANDPSHPERSSAGVNGHTSYSEGLFIGYRWFDHQHLQPLFPFGFGLSYARFEYSRLHVQRAPDGGLTVTFTVRNRGPMASDEVPQVYLGPPAHPPADAQFAVRALVGFDRVHLAANQRRQVSIHVPMRELQYWDTAAGRWQLPGSTRPLYVGASSRDLRLTGVTAD